MSHTDTDGSFLGYKIAEEINLSQSSHLIPPYGSFDTPFNLTPHRASDQQLSKFVSDNGQIFAHSHSREKTKHVSLLKQFYGISSNEMMMYLLDSDDLDVNKIHLNEHVSTSPIGVPINSFMTIKIVSLLPNNTLDRQCPPLQMLNLNRAKSALLVTPFNMPRCENIEFQFNSNSLMLGVQNICLNPHNMVELENFVVYLLTRWTCVLEDLEFDLKISLPRIFVHSSTTNVFTEVQCGQRVKAKPFAFVAAALYMFDDYMYFLPAVDLLPSLLAHCNRLLLTCECTDDDVITNAVNVCDSFCNFFSSFFPSTPNSWLQSTVSPSTLRFVIIPFTLTMMIDIDIVIHYESELDDEDVLILLIMFDCRIFFKSFDNLRQFIVSLEKNYYTVKYKGKNINKWMCKNTCNWNWIGALLFSTDCDDFIIPKVTEFFPCRDEFYPDEFKGLDDFNFTAFLLHQYFTAGCVNIWLTKNDCISNFNSQIFDKIPFRLNCSIHMTNYAVDADSLFPNVPKKFFKVFDNCVYYSHSRTQYHIFNTNVLFEASKPFLLPTERCVCLNGTNYFLPVQFAQELANRELPSCLRLETLMHEIGRMDEEWVRSVIFEFYRISCSGRSVDEYAKLELLMAKLLTFPQLTDLQETPFCVVERCRILNPQIEFPIKGNVKSWFSNHGFLILEFIPQHKYGSEFFMDIGDCIGQWDNVRADSFSSNIFIQDKCCIRLPQFSKIDVFDVILYLTFGKDTIVYPRGLIRCEKIIDLLDRVLMIKHFINNNIAQKRDTLLVWISGQILGRNICSTTRATLVMYILQSFFSNAEDAFLTSIFQDSLENDNGIEYSIILISKFMIILEYLDLDNGLDNGLNLFYKEICYKLINYNIPKFIKKWIKKVSVGENDPQFEQIVIDFILCIFAHTISSTKVGKIYDTIFDNIIQFKISDPEVYHTFEILIYMRDIGAFITKCMNNTKSLIKMKIIIPVITDKLLKNVSPKLKIKYSPLSTLLCIEKFRKINKYF